MTTRSIHQFAEKVALITDGANPIGMATAMQLALNGSFVVLGVPNLAGRVAPPISDLESLGTLAMSHSWNVDADGAAGLVDAVRGKFGRLDLLVNCLDLEAFGSDVVIGEGLTAFVRVADSAVKLMQERPSPRIVNVVSQRDEPLPIIAGANAGVIGYSKALSASLPGNFRVNVVSIRQAEAAAGGFDPELIRPKSAVEPDDAARVILFALSGEAKSINGKVFELG